MTRAALAASAAVGALASGNDPQSTEEFASVTIVVDHLADLEGKTVCKTVWSTEAADEALLSQVKYFNQTGLLLDDGVRAMVATGEQGNVAFVYHVDDRHTQIIVDLAIWTDTFGHPDMGKNSVLGTCASFMALANEMQRAANQAEEPSTILLFKPN